LRLGQQPASTAREAAAGADFVVTSLMDDQSVFDALSGEDGILAGLRRGAVHIGTSTISVLAGFTQSVELGEDPAAAASLKLAGNFFAASLLELLGEALALAEKRGGLLPLANMLKSLLPPMSEYIDRIANRNYEQPGFTLDAGLKDVRLILEAAGEVHVPLPFATVVRDKCLAAQAHGFSQQDWCCFTEIARLNAACPAKSRTNPQSDERPRPTAPTATICLEEVGPALHKSARRPRASDRLCGDLFVRLSLHAPARANRPSARHDFGRRSIPVRAPLYRLHDARRPHAVRGIRQPQSCGVDRHACQPQHRRRQPASARSRYRARTGTESRIHQ